MRQGIETPKQKTGKATLLLLKFIVNIEICVDFLYIIREYKFSGMDRHKLWIIIHCPVAEMTR